MSSRGRRYDGEPKLNIKKVIAVLILLIVIIMCTILMFKITKREEIKETKVVPNSYVTIYNNGKWGVINSKAEIVIEPQYDEMIIIPDPTKSVFICQTNVNIENNTYESKAIDEKSNELFTEYDNIEVLQNIDENNTISYDINALKVSKNGKYGLISFSGKELLACEYENITPLKNVKNSILTIKDGKYGLVDNSGNIIIDNQYTEIRALTNKYEDGYIVKNVDGKYGLINYNKKQILECKYSEILNVYGNNMYVVKENNNVQLIDVNGTVKLTNKFEKVISIDNDNIIVYSNSKYGIMNVNGDTKIDNIYEDIVYAFEDNYIVKKDGKYGIININNEIKVDYKYTYISYMKEENFFKAEKEDGKTDLIDNLFNAKVTGIVSEINSNKGYVKVRIDNEYKYYNFKLEEKKSQDIFLTNTLFLDKKDGKYGFVDKNGIVIVNYIYDDATEQNDYGYAAVKKDGKWGAIDQTGKVIVTPSYSLNQNILIDFIGKWHLAPDLNANYYTDEIE